MKKVLIIVAAVLGFILAACTENEPKKETTVMSNEECLICGAPLEYLEQDTLMECVVCHKKEPSKTRCVKGHYVCSNCHTAGMDSIIALCLEETSKDPIAILEKMMSQPFCHMHGPEHHVLVGAALLTAYNNAVPADTMKIDLQAFIYKSQRYNFSIFLKKIKNIACDIKINVYFCIVNDINLCDGIRTTQIGQSTLLPALYGGTTHNGSLSPLS